MGVWDAATPAGSDPISEGDDRIREMKTALAEALSHEFSTFPGASPSTTPIFIPGFQRGSTANRPTGDSLVEGRFYCNTDLGVIERYNGSTWDAVSAAIPSGTKMVFYQASAPAGWTADAVNDKFLRVVSAGGTGGSTGGTVPASTSLAHTHTIADHTHTVPDHSHQLNNDAPAGGYQANLYIGVTAAGGQITGSDGTAGAVSLGDVYATTDTKSGVSSGNASLTPSTEFAGAFAYADVIIATKD